TLASLLYSYNVLSSLPYFLLLHASSLDIYPLSLHDALPIFSGTATVPGGSAGAADRTCLRAARAARTAITAETTAITANTPATRSEEHTSELQSRFDLVCRLLLEKKKKK